MTPTITMLTPVFNGAATIAQTFQSLREQAPHLTEYIVIDAMSSDGTQALVQANADLVTQYIREPDRGLYDAMNKGIAHAHGEVVGIINADDRLCDGALARVAQAFADPGVSYVYSDVLTLDEQGRPYGQARAKEPQELTLRSPFGLDWRTLIPFCHASLFVRKSVYDQLGGFDLSFRLAADHDFIARMIQARLKGVKLEAPLAYFQYGGLSASSRVFHEKKRISIKHGVHPWMAEFNRIRFTLGQVKARLMKKY